MARTTFILSLLALSRAALLVSAQEPPAAANDSAVAAQRLELMNAQSAAYKLTLGERSMPLALHEGPLLRFSNPVGGVPDGIVVMWKDGARPAVFAQVFQTKEGLWIHECQSLAAAPLSMQQGAKTFWSPQEAAAGFQPLADGPAAAAGASRRLVQMKAIAAEFSASDDFKISSRDQETTRHALRLLPTPVYRYADAAAGIADGAVFAFVHGTDPEVFLVLELRSDGAGPQSWHYTLAPMTCWAVQVNRGKTPVWSVPERMGKNKPQDLYHVWVHKPTP
jgi:hypothetical protein